MRTDAKYVVGIGCRRGVSADQISDRIHELLEAHNITHQSVVCLASCDVKKDEAGLREVAERNAWPLVFYSSEELNRVNVPNPSAKVMETIGTTSVCEAAALLASGSKSLVVPKQKYGNMTLAIAE